MIRTPMEPIQTFTNCPLIILRCVRFADRFNFELGPGFLEAARCPQIHQLLLNKISFERNCAELEKILLGRQPERAVTQLQSAGIWQLLNKIPEEYTASV